MGKWIAKIELKDGKVIEKDFPYNADGDEMKEDAEWDGIVDQILENHDVLYYSITYSDE